MADPQTTVRGVLAGADVRPITLGAFHAHRERKRRNERLAAGALGLAILLAGAVVASIVADQGRERTGGASTPRNGAIAVVSNRGNSGALELRGPDGTVRIADGEVIGSQGRCAGRGYPCWFADWSWSPDGSRLAFTYGEPSGGLLGDMSVYMIDADGENLRLIARCPPRSGDPTGTCDNSGALSWSPDGTRMTFTSGEVLYVVDVRSDEVEPIAGCDGCAYHGEIHGPVWSPTGDWIAFGGDSTLELVTPDGRAWRTIVKPNDVPNPGRPAEPAWSPDGTQLTFSSEVGVLVVNEDGSDLRVIAVQAAIVFASPSWSPDGRHVIFMNTPELDGRTIAEITVVDPDGTEKRVLYRSGCCPSDWGGPIYSPDGTKIAFSLGLDPGGGGQYVMDADGTHVQRSSGSGSPAWQGLPS
jgi:Tol biopolymer transport system component